MAKKKRKAPKKRRVKKEELQAKRSLEIIDARHRPTEETRREVTRARFAFMCDEDLAHSLGISVPRLHECYAFELTRGPAESRRKLISAMFSEAICGKPAAFKQLEAMTSAPLFTELHLSREKSEQLKGYVVRTQDIGDDEDSPPRNPKYVGKKEQAKLDAKEAAKGNRWGSLDDEDGKGTLQ
jgi:hypothetical protein